MAHLRSSIVGTATAGLQKVPISHDIAEAKVSNLDVHFAVQKQVLWLEVSVHHHVAMAILHTRRYLLEKAACLFF